MNISKNLTGVNNTMDFWDLFPRSAAITYVALLILELVVIIIGNAIVIAAFTKTRQLRQKKCYWFLINLAVADLLVGMIAGAVYVYFVGTRSNLVEFRPYLFSLQMYRAVLFLSYFQMYASLTNLAIISLERMYAILWPLKHRVLRARNYHVMIGLSWTLPIFPSLVPAAPLFSQLTDRASFYIWLTIDCIFAVIILLSYVSIWIKLKFFKHHQHQATTAQERKLTKSLFLVTAASMMTIVTGSALSKVAYFRVLDDEFSWNNALYIWNFAVLLIFASSLLNPIVYAFRIPQLRRAVTRLLCRQTNQIQEPAIEMRNRAEVINRQACAVIINVPEPKMAANE